MISYDRGIASLCAAVRNQNSDSPGGWLRDSSERPVAMGHQARRKQRNRYDLALKSSFVPPGSRTGLIARPHMYWLVLRESLTGGATHCRAFGPSDNRANSYRSAQVHYRNNETSQLSAPKIIKKTRRRNKNTRSRVRAHGRQVR
jgi:hypothetical protein